MLSYTEARNDAGLLREYIVQQYGYALTTFAPNRTYRAAMRMVRRLARLINSTVDAVLLDIRSDYELSDES